ncbi:dienelactone hydrolase family protein [Actinomadura rugatobispora]|uniref:Dienelactone hydrolase family protein n=1 Tax=Actinomadura rugatobispora TaxID=1994 RepID=A0ABW0ZQ31_9ACTN|nr:dienelactone hydrolase family protein [Actinomadura rugatobispora]
MPGRDARRSREPLSTEDGPLSPHAAWTDLATPAGPMRAYAAEPGGTPKGAVVVLQEAFGVNAHIQSVANRLATHGFVAVAPELFHRTGHRTVDYTDRPTAMGLIAELGPQEVTADVAAAVEHARLYPTSQATCSLVGFCFGARAAFTAATAIPGLDAVAAFYGPGIAAGPHAVLDRAAGISARMLLVHGAEDPTISADDITATEQALDAASVRYETVVHPGAGHAFCCDARPDAYRAEPALDAWVRLLHLLESKD